MHGRFQKQQQQQTRRTNPSKNQSFHFSSRTQRKFFARNSTPPHISLKPPFFLNNSMPFTKTFSYEKISVTKRLGILPQSCYYFLFVRGFFLYFSYLMILVKDTYLVLRTYQKCIQDDNGTPLPSRQEVEITIAVSFSGQNFSCIKTIIRKFCKQTSSFYNAAGV